MTQEEKETMSTEQILARQESYNPYDELPEDDDWREIYDWNEKSRADSLDEINNHISRNTIIEPDGKLRIKNWSELTERLREKGKQGRENLSNAFTRISEEIKAEEAAKQKQSESPPLERRKINSKEKFMSDVYENEGEKRNPKEEAFLNGLHQRKVIADAIKNGTLACLPGKDGFADTTPAVNIVRGTVYHSANLLFLKEHQRENGFPSAEYVTHWNIENARKDNPDLFIRKGEKGVSIYVSEENEKTGEMEIKNHRLFNIAQTTKPAAMKEWAEQQHQKELQKKLEYLQTQYGTGYTLPEPKQKEPGPEIVCSSTDPEKYLGQYLAAVSLGGKFKASPEQAAEFSQKMVDSMYAKMINKETGEPVLGKEGQPVSNPFKLEEISRNASAECKTFMRDLRIETQKQNQPQQEQTQSRGFGR